MKRGGEERKEQAPPPCPPCLCLQSTRSNNDSIDWHVRRMKYHQMITLVSWTDGRTDRRPCSECECGSAVATARSGAAPAAALSEMVSGLLGRRSVEMKSARSRRPLQRHTVGRVTNRVWGAACNKWSWRVVVLQASSHIKLWLGAHLRAVKLLNLVHGAKRNDTDERRVKTAVGRPCSSVFSVILS